MAEEVLARIPGLIECRQQTLGDPEICIAIIDSRADLSHPSFSGAQVREIVPMWLQSVMDRGGAAHGTHVASLIFGQSGGPVEGIAPRCRGIIIPVYGETEDGELKPCSQEDLARAISLALEAGAHLINISGGELIESGEEDPLLAKVIASCDRQDVVVIAATGNEGCECLHMPAALQTVLAVGAADADGQPLPFSNWDASLASHGVLAPGENIRGAVPGNGVASHSGTSFACPIVTGAAALLLSMQKASGQKASPKAVREAIVASATPCSEAEQAVCDRMLGGRLNVHAAYASLFPDQSGNVHPARRGLSRTKQTHAIRAPPAGIAAAEWPRPDGRNFGEPGKREGGVMTNGHFQVQPDAVVGLNQGVAPQVFEAPQQSAVQMQAPAPGARASAVDADSAAPTMNVAAPPLAFAGQQPAALRPQGVAPSCNCGGAQPAQSVTPSQQEMMPAQHEATPAQQPQAGAHQGAIPMQAPYGTQPPYSPAQRTAMRVMHSAPAGSQQMAMPAVRGITPSQMHGSCPCPLPNDFISAENSQLIYVIGTLGYDFITDARRDYFVQQLRDMSEQDEYINLFKPTLGLQNDVIYYPEDHRAMAAYLFQNYELFDHPLDPGRFGFHAEDTGSVVWVLYQENQPLYALRPLHTFANRVLIEFANMLFNQSRPVNKLGDDGKPLMRNGEAEANPDRADRISIAGRIIGDITLYNGQRVPVLDVSLRALYQWTTSLLVSDLAHKHPDVLNPDSDFYKSVTNFLDRIYYEVRNLGQSPSDRAINFMATNVFEAGDVFAKAIANVDAQGAPSPLELDSIFAEKSPICRPKSDCWDVVMRFFDPKHRLERALDEYRLTIDVNDITPVPIGTTRKWARFA